MIENRRLFTTSIILAILGLFIASCGGPEPFSADTVPRATPQSISSNPTKDGVIAMDTYKVAIAQRGETLEALANRLGLEPTVLARANGIRPEDKLTNAEVIVLPKGFRSRHSGGAIISSALKSNDKNIDIKQLAQTAIDDAQPHATTAAKPPKQSLVAKNADGPVRHKVERGETAFTISRLYDVSVRSLAEWNGLDKEFTIRDGQYLLIPVGTAPANTIAAVSKPGNGSATPIPPSAKTPLPYEDVPAETPFIEEPPLAKQQTPSAHSAQMVFPIDGTIIREYAKGSNDGIDMLGSAGAPVFAAAGGKVAALTTDADQVPIMVIKHPDNILTVYANVHNISVVKGDVVSRGQKIATLPETAPVSIHFEVRKGFNSVDPMNYLQ